MLYTVTPLQHPRHQFELRVKEHLLHVLVFNFTEKKPFDVLAVDTCSSSSTATRARHNTSVHSGAPVPLPFFLLGVDPCEEDQVYQLSAFNPDLEIAMLGAGA